ncbi:hypothetical protein G6F43_002590 [Rhizopus delemar]|nr:hypothetical protein G6F43_002590 [Rhizopus delemar]
MPVPVEYSSVRRMSTITIPKQDINFDAYDFQLCQPQNDIKGAFESRELEATFCRDFECCGLVLEDLHDLLQHYEECHVEEEENSSFFDESSVDEGCWSSSSSVNEENEGNTIDSIKKKAAAYISDMYYPSTPGEEEKNKKKRTYSNAFDLLTQSAVKKIALASGDLPSPLLSDEEFLAHAGALLASAQSNNSNADKPYKCPVGGCDKAYKNPNGLKYHNQHGHCNLNNDDLESLASKPYQCTIGDCGKRYKNLNGLKYHIEHSHMAALNHTLATFGSSIFNNSSAFEVSSLDDIISTTSTLF